ncbi:hypothetical protein B4Q13_16615, partial [Lacticaseibacillus rhamnosus]
MGIRQFRPTSAGGHNWQATSYHEPTNLLLAPLVQACQVMVPQDPNLAGTGNAGGASRSFYESPGYEKMPKHEQGMVMHASLPMGKHNAIMATDALESMGMTLTMGNNFHICVNTESEAETERYFNALSEGG